MKSRPIVKLLLDANAEIDVRNRGGLNPLVVAAQNNSVDILDLLINHNKPSPPPKKKAKATVTDECIICMGKSKNCLFMPCAHLVCCLDCGEKKEMKACPMCEAKIERKVKVYM
jgi:hypothetical protein